MIIYCDLRRPPIFRDSFIKSGVDFKNHYRNLFTLLAAGHRGTRRLPSTILFSGPKARDRAAGGLYSRLVVSGRKAGDRDQSDDKIIVFDSYTTPRYLYWLCRRNPDRRVILWFWNRVRDPEWLRHIPPQVEVWTYSRSDSERYGLKHNTQFFFDCYAEEAEQFVKNAGAVNADADIGQGLPGQDRNDFDGRKPQGQDGGAFDSLEPRGNHQKAHGSDGLRAFFLGRDKGRAEALGELAKELGKAGVTADFRIVPPPAHRPGIIFENVVRYQETIATVKGADILVDLYEYPDAGLSLRPMEALFFGKKLITNNTGILDADFYDPANIYVLGKDERKLKEFVHSPVVPVDPEIRDRYLLSNWLKRFDEV